LPEFAVETLFFLTPPGQAGGDLSLIHKTILPFFHRELNENQADENVKMGSPLVGFGDVLDFLTFPDNDHLLRLIKYRVLELTRRKEGGMGLVVFRPEITFLEIVRHGRFHFPIKDDHPGLFGSIRGPGHLAFRIGISGFSEPDPVALDDFGESLGRGLIGKTIEVEKRPAVEVLKDKGQFHPVHGAESPPQAHGFPVEVIIIRVFLPGGYRPDRLIGRTLERPVGKDVQISEARAFIVIRRVEFEHGLGVRAVIMAHRGPVGFRGEEILAPPEQEKGLGLILIGPRDQGNIIEIAGFQLGKNGPGQEVIVLNRGKTETFPGYIFAGGDVELFQNFLVALLAQAGEVRGGTSELFGRPPAGLIAGFPRPGHIAPAALDDRALEKALGQGGGQEGADAGTPGRLPEDRDVSRIPAEVGDIIFNPLQGKNLVEHPIVAGALMGVFPGQLLVGQESEGSQAVIDAGHDEIAVRGQAVAEPGRGGRRPAEKTASVDKDHHREGPGFPRAPDIQVQAVFRIGSRGVIKKLVHAELSAHVSPAGGVAHPLPGDGRLGRSPAGIADRGGGVGDAFPETGAAA